MIARRGDGVTKEDFKFKIANLKLSAHRAGLPGIVISFILCPGPACLSMAGRSTFRPNLRLQTSGEKDTSNSDCGMRLPSPKRLRAGRECGMENANLDKKRFDILEETSESYCTYLFVHWK